MSLVNQSFLNRARTDKFLVTLDVPDALKRIDKNKASGNNDINFKRLQFSVFGILLPQLEVPALEIRYSGNTLYQSSHTRNSYPPVTMNFSIDNEFNNYWVIYKWLQILHDDVEGIFDKRELIRGTDFTQYQSDITLHAINEFDKPVIEFKYTRAFPTVLGGVEYSDKNPQEALSSFTFVYSQIHTKKFAL